MKHGNRFIDLTGQKIGRWTVLSFGGIDKRHTMWLCKCSCGTTRMVKSVSLRSGRSMSCGCYHRELMSANKIATTHGLKSQNQRLYRIWQNMLNRCRNKNMERYRAYGARGISVCEEWHEYPAFYNWAMANGYEDNLSIDRINVDGNYEPANCQWITMAENSQKAIEDRRRKKNEI